MKRKWVSKCLFVFVMILVVFPPLISEAKTKKINLQTCSSGVGKNAIVELSWSSYDRISGDKIEVYRAKANLEGKRTGKYKRIAKLPVSAKKYLQVVSSKKNYCYKIKVYKKKKGKKVYKFVSNEATAFVRDKVELRLYEESDSYVELSISMEENKEFDKGIELYRKEGNGSYQIIRTIKIHESFTDELVQDNDIKPGRVYTYKARAYGMKKNKKIYSAFSEEIIKKTFNQSPKYSFQLFTQQGNVSEIKMQFTNDQYNEYSITLSKEITKYNIHMKKNDKDAVRTDLITRHGVDKNYVALAELILTQYSVDGKSWKDVSSNGIMLKPGQTVYLSYKSVYGNTFAFNLDNYDSSVLEIPTKDSTIEINFIKMKVE